MSPTTRCTRCSRPIAPASAFWRWANARPTKPLCLDCARSQADRLWMLTIVNTAARIGGVR